MCWAEQDKLVENNQMWFSSANDKNDSGEIIEDGKVQKEKSEMRS